MQTALIVQQCISYGFTHISTTFTHVISQTSRYINLTCKQLQKYDEIFSCFLQLITLLKPKLTSIDLSFRTFNRTLDREVCQTLHIAIVFNAIKHFLLSSNFRLKHRKINDLFLNKVKNIRTCSAFISIT